jgi:hypothetical protein
MKNFKLSANVRDCLRAVTGALPSPFKTLHGGAMARRVTHLTGRCIAC